MSDNVVELKRWSDEEVARLVEYGPEAFMQNTKRSWHSVRAKYNKLGYYLSEPVQPEPQMLHSPNGTPVEEPRVTQVVGVVATEKPDIEAIKARHRASFKRVNDIARRKLYQQVTISHAPVMIALVADVHLGSPGTDIDRVYEEQALINNTPGAYTFLLGDIADSFLVGRLRDINMTHEITVPDEWALVEDYFAGWKNLVGVVGGNHDAWSKTLVGMDLHRKLINDGKVLYDTDDMRLTVNVGPYPIKFRMRHQFLGSSQFNVTHAAEKSVKFDDPSPDILVSGHTHTGALAREFSHAGRRKIAIQLGTYKMHDQFAEKVGFPQSDNSTAAAVIVMPDGSYFGTGSLKAACSFMRTIYDRAA